MSQPLTAIAIPWSGFEPAEVDTWGAGDSVTVYSPVTVFVASVSASNITSYNSGVYFDTIVVDGSIASAPVAFGPDTYMVDSYSTAFVTAEDNIQHGAWINSWETKGILTLPTASAFSSLQFEGGVYTAGVTVGSSLAFGGGTIIAPGSNGAVLVYSDQLSDVYIDTGATIATFGSAIANTYPGQSAPYVWGPGTLQVNGYFIINANAAAPTLLVAHINMNAIANGCSMVNNASPGLACGIPVTGTNVDAHNGFLFNPTGQAILTLSSVF